MNVEQANMTLYEVKEAITVASDQITQIINDLAAKTGMKIEVLVSNMMTGDGVAVYNTRIQAELRAGEWYE